MTRFARCFVVVLAVALSAAAQPSVTAVFNAFGGTSQTNLSPGVFFAVQGSGLADANPSFQTASQPYPTVFLHASVSLTATSGGTPIQAKMWYASPTQINAILPSTITPGTYNLTVLYNNQTSTAKQVTVGARSFGIATANSAGYGPAQATDGNVNNGISLVRYTSSTVSYEGYNWVLGPAGANDTLVFWGSGGGADILNDTGGTSGDQTAAANAQVFIDGVAVTPLYFGTSSGYPGLWQVNVKLPGLAPNCTHNVYVMAGGQQSNTVTIATAAAGQNACTSGFLTAAQLAKLDAGGTLTVGYFQYLKNLFTISVTIGGLPITQSIDNESIGGAFTQLTAAGVGSQNYSNIGQCIVISRVGDITSIATGLTANNLDAGATLPVSGPGLAAGAAMTRGSDNSYNLSLNANTLTAGTYTTSGSGGADVGAFSQAISVPGDFNPTNFDAITSINRSQTLHMTWTGGGSGYVGISGFAATTISGSLITGNEVAQATIFICTFPASAGAGDVPSSVLSQLPVVGSDISSASFGFLSINAVSDGKAGQFTAPLTKGGNIDFGLIDYAIGKSKNITYQ